MKKLVALILCFVMIFALCACGTPAAKPKTAEPKEVTAAPAEVSTAPQEKKVKLIFGLTAAAEDLTTKAAELFAEKVAVASNGSIEISVLPASQLGDANAEMESVIAGAQDIFMEGQITYMATYGVDEAKAESFGVVATGDELRTFLTSDTCAEMEQKFLDINGVRIFGTNWIRTPVVMATKMPISTLEDMKGVKLRVVPSESTIAGYSALGFNPTSVSYNEVYLSLSQGVIEGTIAPLDAMYSMKFYEVAPYILKLGVSTTNMCFFINEAKFQSLSENQQNILLTCSEEAGDWYSEQVQLNLDTAIKAMEEGGATVTEASEELWSKCFELWSAAGKEFEAKGTMPAGSYDLMFSAAHP